MLEVSDVSLEMSCSSMHHLVELLDLTYEYLLILSDLHVAKTQALSVLFNLNTQK